LFLNIRINKIACFLLKKKLPELDATIKRKQFINDFFGEE
jgi:hypothetical protein